MVLFHLGHPILQPDNVRLILSDSGWHCGVLKADSRAYFSLVNGFPLFRCLISEADIISLVNVLFTRGHGHSDLFLVVLRETTDKSDVILSLFSLWSICEFDVEGVHVSLNLRTVGV